MLSGSTNKWAGPITLIGFGLALGIPLGYIGEEIRSDGVTVPDPAEAKVAVPLANATVRSSFGLSGVAGDFENADLFIAVQRGPDEYWIKERIRPNDQAQWTTWLDDALDMDFRGEHFVLIVEALNDEAEDELLRRLESGGDQPANTLDGIEAKVHDRISVICCEVE